MRRRDLARDDRGVVLILAAITLVTLLVLSAFAIDVGGAYNARRQDQTAADAAALAAGSPTVMANTQLVVTEVLDRLNDNLSEPLTLADLNTCGDDTERLPVVAQVGGQSYNCISFNNARTQVRVRVPPRGYETTFARLVGVDEIEHTAFAIAGTPPQGAFGGVLPFGLTATAGVGHVCLKTGPGPLDSAPCDGPATGNFGYLNFAHFGSPALGTPAGHCSGDGSQRVAANLAMGVDHDLSLWGQTPHGNTTVVDSASCGAIAAPNAATTTTGNMPNVIGDGLFSGSNFYDNQPARLRRVAPVTPAYFRMAQIGPYLLDDNPLWEFIDPELGLDDDVPRSCHRDQFDAPTGGLGDMSALPADLRSRLNTRSVDDRILVLLSRCISHYQHGSWSYSASGFPNYTESQTGCALAPCTDPVFSRETTGLDGVADIQQTPRFGYVPVFHQDTPPNGHGTVTFARFRAIFIQRVCIGQPCSLQFDPGVGFTAGSADTRALGFTAFAIPDGMLPYDLGSPTAPLSRPTFSVLLR